MKSMHRSSAHQGKERIVVIERSTQIIIILFGLILVLFSYSPWLGQNSFWAEAIKSLGITIVLAGGITFALERVFQRKTLELLFDFQKEIKGELEKSLSTEKIYRNANKIDLQNIFTDRQEAYDVILTELKDENVETVRLMGISLRDFFLGSQRPHQVIEEILAKKNSRKEIRVLVIDPNSESAYTRAEREETNRFGESFRYSESNLCREVMTSISRLILQTEKHKAESKSPRNDGDLEDSKVSSKNRSPRIQAAAYEDWGTCLLVITDKSAFVELYHLGDLRDKQDGKGERGAGDLLGGKVAISQFPSSSMMYRIISSHYDYSWQVAKPLENIMVEKNLGRFRGIVRGEIRNIFGNRDAAFERILYCIRRDSMEDTENENFIWLQGISLRQFFLGQGPSRVLINSLLDSKKREEGKIDAKLRVLIIDREQKQAVYRSEREEGREPSDGFGRDKEDNSRHASVHHHAQQTSYIEPADQGHDKEEEGRRFEMVYENSNLFNEVGTTIARLRVLIQEHRDCIDAKTYQCSPSCFVIMTKNSLFLEQYHYGEEGDGLLGGQVPIFEYTRDSTTYKKILGHLEFVWDHYTTKAIATNVGNSA